jgi:hypothetical protein
MSAAGGRAGGPVYRVRQLGRAVASRPSAPDLRTVREALTPAQQVLFAGMSARDQWHSIQTWRLMGQAPDTDPALRTAALLHDAGKGFIRLPERVLYVMLARFPRLLRRAAAPGPTGPRAALYRMDNHALTGARLAQEAGASADAVSLIRRHHHPPGRTDQDPRLEALIRADGLA